MSRKFQTLRGFRDLLPGQTEVFARFEAKARDILACYGYREIRTPILEPTELFVRSVGEETDIVGKEMFSFQVDDDRMTMRPEVTAAVCRAFIQHGLDRKGHTRLWYMGPCFRKERPQKGRYRQFHQVGAEVFGEGTPETDVETLAMAADIVRAAGASDIEIFVNSIGDGACRPVYRQKLIAFLESIADKLSAESQARIRTNPMRVLDSKLEHEQELFREAPSIADHLCDVCRAHYDAVREGLTKLGIAHTCEPRLVRGLDYYVNTTFEIRARTGLGAQNTVLGGGRYDGLVRALGGGDVPGLGWAAGIERLLLAAGFDEEHEEAPQLDVYYVTLGPQAREGALAALQALRALGLRASWDTAGHGLGGQMKRAGRSGARFALLVGDDELARGTATVKDLVTGEQMESSAAADAIARLVREKAGSASGESR